MTAVHRDPDAIVIGQGVLAEMRAAAPSLVFAAIVTDDGFELAHAPANVIDSGRFGSMTSSVQALSEAVTRELSIGSSGYVVIAADRGHVLQLRVPGQPLILAALFDGLETLGSALAAARRSAQHLAEALARVNHLN